MKYYYNKAQPNIEYGMLSSRYLNNPKRKPNADCLVTYYYTSVSEPLGGTYYRNRDYYIIPVKVTPKVYAQLMKRDKKEHNNNHKHDRRYLDVEKYYRQRGEIDEDDRETNAWECIADKKTLNFENDIIEELDKKALLSTFSKSDRLIVKLYEAGVGQKHIAKKIGKTQSYVSKRLERLLDLIEAERLNDGSRTKKEIEFELAWKKFIYSHKMPKDIDVIFETFNYLIGERMLEELGMAKDNEKQFVNMVQTAKSKEIRKDLSAKTKECDEAEKRVKALDRIIQSLYEDKVCGNLTDERFVKMSQAYEQEQETLTERIKVLRKELSTAKEDADNVTKFMRLVKRYTEITELTPEVVREFIEKVIVHQAEKVNGKKRQAVEIIYNCVGVIPNPTQE